MAGGPGEAAILDIPFLVDAGINADRDLIVMNQRGTLYDDPDLNCPELDRYYARQVALRVRAPSTGRAQAAAAAACHRRLIAQGIDLSAYNTTENEADFVDLLHTLRMRNGTSTAIRTAPILALSLMRDHPDGHPNRDDRLRRSAGYRQLAVDLEQRVRRHHHDFQRLSGRSDLRAQIPESALEVRASVRNLEEHPIVRRVVPPQGGDP